jgi:peptidyl-prolyl cis-trans isomerase D
MLELFRKGVGSWFAAILLGILIMSFALWGIGDPLSTLGSNEIAEVGGEKVTPVELQRSFERDYSRLLQQTGEGVTKQLAIQVGMGAQSAANLIRQKAQEVESSNLGIRASDQELANYILSIPVFQDETGTFNRSFFENFASLQGYSTKEFEELLRTELSSNKLIDAIANNIKAPDITSEMLTKFASEERTSEILTIPASAMTGFGEATDELLTAYYQENPDNYMAPEYRDISYFEISASELSNSVNISGDQVRAEYDARIMEFTQSEKRGYIQMLLDDQASADAAYTELENGKSFKQVVIDRAGTTVEDSTFEAQTFDEFADTYGEDAANMLFDAEDGTYTAPIESGFGVYIFKVNGVVTGTVESFESVRDQLAAELKLDQAIDRLYELRNLIDDELAAGSPIEIIAGVANAELKTVSNVSIDGIRPDGTASTELPLIVEFLDYAFQAEIGGELELYEGIANKFYMLDVVNITQSTLRDFEDVKDQVKTDWEQNRRETLAQELAERIIGEYSASENTSKALADYQNIVGSNFTVNVVTVGRANQNNDVSADIHASIFSQNIGDIEMIPAANGDGYVLVRVVGRSFEENVEEEALANTKLQIENSYQNDLIGAYFVYLYDSLPVVIREENIQSVLDFIAAPDQQ